MDASTPAIAVENLNYRIEEHHILKDISLKLDKGGFIGLIGPNGAGKTTLLKCLNGVLEYEGSVYLYGKPLAVMKEKEIARQIALMHQNTHITFPFQALEVVLMGRYPHLGRLRGETKADFDMARSYMDYTDTRQFEVKPINQISGGERQRVLFAKVLTQETDIILLDEPTASLDILHQEQIFQYAKELVQQGKTVIAAIHDLKVAARYCNRLVLMKDGSILREGSAEEVLTSENLSTAYNVNALVYRNKVTGLLDFYIQGSQQARTGLHVHVIGGGGAASGILRELFERGHRVTTGVLAHGDSDLQCANVFGMEALICDPFSDISDDLHEKNIEQIRRADCTILGNIPFGRYNLKNLEAAAAAKRLIIIEEYGAEERDFTGGRAAGIYMELKKKAVVTSFAQLHEVI